MQGHSPKLELGVAHVETPLGVIALAFDQTDTLYAASFESLWNAEPVLSRLYGVSVVLETAPVSSTLSGAFGRYFEGDCDALECLAIASGGTAFQRLVWTALKSIRAGTVASYGALAHAIGRPKAMRAVGLANGANPLALVVPCHRIIGADQTLIGYGGGLERKRWLLEHEGVVLKSVDSVQSQFLF